LSRDGLSTMREPDQESLVYLKGFAPFEVHITQNPHEPSHEEQRLGGFRCELCGAIVTLIAVCKTQRLPGKEFYCCLGLCAERLLGASQYVKVCGQSVDLSTTDKSLLSELSPEEALALVGSKEAAHVARLAQGFENSRISLTSPGIVGILTQYRRCGILSRGQFLTLWQYVSACGKELKCRS
jgi:hypothetical protein